MIEHSSDDVKYLIKDVIAEGMLNAVVGASSAGKSTWVWQGLESMYKRTLFMGKYQTAPLPKTFYASLERHTKELGRFRALEIPESLLVHKSYRTQLDSPNLLVKIFNEIPEDTKLVVLDGVGFVVEKLISQFHIGQFVAKLSRMYEERGMTALLIHHTAKVKNGPNGGYDDPREMASGSGAWAQMSACLQVLVKMETKDIENPYRKAWVLQTNSKDQMHYIKMNDSGLLVPTTQEEAENSTSRDEKESNTNILEYMPEGPITPKDLSQTTGLSRDAVMVKLRKAVTSGLVSKEGWGEYRRVPLS